MTDAFTRQVQDFTKQAQEMFSAGKDAKVPENVSAFAEDAIAKSRDAYRKFTAMAKDNAKVAEEVMLDDLGRAKSIGEKIVANTLANTEAAFEAAQAMARARTFPEITSAGQRLAAAVCRRRIAVEGTLRAFEQGYQAGTRNGWRRNDQVLRAVQNCRQIDVGVRRPFLASVEWGTSVQASDAGQSCLPRLFYFPSGRKS